MKDRFQEFKRCTEHWAILDDDIYNFDKTGYLIGAVSGSLNIVPIYCETVYINDPANRELVTATECISAGGFHVPPMIIFKKAFHLCKYFKNNTDGNILWARSDSGFTNDELTFKWLEHFDKFTKKRTIGQYQMLIFDGYGSHITQNFLDYCWTHQIRPFQPPHSTHLTQLLDVVAFQKAKHKFKKFVRKMVFYDTTKITKTDFFSIFDKFSTKTFTSKICKAAFKKAGLIPFDPLVVLLKMKEFGGIQDQSRKESIDDNPIEFATPPPSSWSEFNTLITNTGRRGIKYVQDCILAGPITPTIIRVFEKIEKAADLLILKGQLSTKLLAANKASEKERIVRNSVPNKVVRKYGEIYGNQARRQIAEMKEKKIG